MSAAAAAAPPAGPSGHEPSKANTPAAAATAAAAAAVCPQPPVAAVVRGGSSASLCSLISLVASEAHSHYRRHLLVGVDNSSNSVHALAWALDHLYRPGDKLHLVHVVPEPPTLHPWPGLFVPPDDALEQQEFKEASTMIQAAFAPLITRRAAPCDAHLIVAPQDPGSVVGVMLDKADDLGADALVVAPHGKAGLSEWWLGSVSRCLLRHSPVPVVVVPPPDAG